MKFTLSIMFSFLLLVCFSARPVFADPAGEGSLMYVFTQPDGTGFFKVEVHEKDGKYDGQISSSGGFGDVKGRFIGDTLMVQLGSMYQFNLKYQVSTDKRTKRENFRGFWTENRPSEFKAYTDLKSNTPRMDAKIGDETTANYWSSGKDFQMNFGDTQNKAMLWAKKIKNEAGSCEGAISPPDMPSSKLVYFYCESSGTLEDSFFRRTVDLIAWVLPYLL